MRHELACLGLCVNGFGISFVDVFCFAFNLVFLFVSHFFGGSLVLFMLV